MAVSLLVALAPMASHGQTNPSAQTVLWQEAPSMVIAAAAPATPAVPLTPKAASAADLPGKDVAIGRPQEQNTIVFSSAPGGQLAQAPLQGGAPPSELTNERLEKTQQPPIQRTLYQLGGGKPGDEGSGFYVQTDLPGKDRLFGKRSSEREFRRWIEEDFVRTEAGQRVIFPESIKVTNETYQPRSFAGVTYEVTPFNVCHGRLYFEQPNWDRHGWEIGYLQPLISTGRFYYDVFMLPYHSWTDPCATRQCSAGKCLPGERTPLFLYPERISVTGLAAQTLAVGAGFFIFP
jgi:hypothetical protein